ncbi:MAG: alpha-D-ribose 1-methylphosphonate 5-triphosphate diphosphatase [Sphingobium limneticum]
MIEQHFVNARVVTRETDFHGGVVVVDGRISVVEPDLVAAPGALDMEGDFLIPGLVDLHTDNLERHYEPRPGVTLDAIGAVLAHDGMMATAGITTVFDSLSLHGDRKGFDRGAALAPMLSALNAAREEGILRADHQLHLRCEVTNPGLLKLLEPQLDNPLLRLLSIMDHTPGQRQWRNMSPADMRKMALSYGASEQEIDQHMIERLSERAADAAHANREAVAAIAREYRIPLATHDDESIEHVADAVAIGAVIAEFPVTLEAAAEARRRGMAVLMGAPNLIRGGSHSNNVSAAEVAKAGYLDGLTSDYAPISSLRAAFCLTELPFGMPLAAAVATVSATPAEIVGLTDRGVIASGRRADLVRVMRSKGGWPVVRGVWREGRRVA